MIRENGHPVEDLIMPRHVLLSVFDKGFLEEVIVGVLDVNEDARFYSTGGTGKRVLEVLERSGATGNYTSVEEFTGAREMEGGLVKTLHPKIHGGLLAERGNPAHEKYLAEFGDPDPEVNDGTGFAGVYFDVFIGNLYPFTQTVARGANPEEARVNIDIGGPTMTMASAKNWPSVAVLSTPEQYDDFTLNLERHQGTTLEQRFGLAQRAMREIGGYRTSIGDHFVSLDYQSQVLPHLNIRDAA